jgi:hypothetical protein
MSILIYIVSSIYPSFIDDTTNLRKTGEIGGMTSALDKKYCKNQKIKKPIKGLK